MELRWYWRVLKRQARVIWTTFVVVAILSALYTAYAFYGGHYKATATIQFEQQPPVYSTQNIPTDPNQAAWANGQAAAGDAKLFTEGDAFFKGISAYLKAQYHLSIDYKSIHVGVTPVGGRQIKIDYSSSDSTKAKEFVAGGIYVLQHDFLPSYRQKVQQTTIPGIKQNVYEPPITMSIFDPINARNISLSTTAIGWVVKALIGLVLGVALAFLWEYLDESIHDEHDVRNWMGGAPTLGVIPGGRMRTA